MQKERIIKRTVLMGFEADAYSQVDGETRIFRPIIDPAEFTKVLLSEGYYAKEPVPVYDEFEMAVNVFLDHAILVRKTETDARTQFEKIEKVEKI